MELGTLVQDAQAGNRDAANSLAANYRSFVYNLALGWLKDPGEADTLAQDVLTHAYLKLNQLQCPRAYSSWLRQITYRMAMNYLQRRRFTSELPDDSPGQFKTGEDEALFAEELALLRAAVARLKPADRRTITDFYLNQKSIKELADEHNAPIGTIKRRLHVARHRLREQIESSRQNA